MRDYTVIIKDEDGDAIFKQEISPAMVKSLKVWLKKFSHYKKEKVENDADND